MTQNDALDLLERFIKECGEERVMDRSPIAFAQDFIMSLQKKGLTILPEKSCDFDETKKIEKRTVRIRGFVGSNGQLNMSHWETPDLKDSTDLALCAEDFDPDVQIQEISVEFELDVKAIFESAKVKGELSVGDKNSK